MKHRWLCNSMKGCNRCREGSVETCDRHLQHHTSLRKPGLTTMLKQKEMAVNGVLRLFRTVFTSTSLHDTTVHSLFVSSTCKQGALQSPIP